LAKAIAYPVDQENRVVVYRYNNGKEVKNYSDEYTYSAATGRWTLNTRIVDLTQQYVFDIIHDSLIESSRLCISFDSFQRDCHTRIEFPDTTGKDILLCEGDNPGFSEKVPAADYLPNYLAKAIAYPVDQENRVVFQTPPAKTYCCVRSTIRVFSVHLPVAAE